MKTRYSLSPKQIVSEFLAGKGLGDIATQLRTGKEIYTPILSLEKHVLRVIRLELRRATHAAENYYRIITK